MDEKEIYIALAYQTPRGKVIAALLRKYWPDWVEALTKTIDQLIERDKLQIDIPALAQQIAIDAIWGYGFVEWDKSQAESCAQNYPTGRLQGAREALLKQKVPLVYSLFDDFVHRVINTGIIELRTIALS